MKKLLLSLFAVSSLSAGAQVTVFEDSFETYEDFSIDFAPWINIDLDGLGTYSGGIPDGTEIPNQFDPKAYMIFNPSAAGATNATDGVGGETENRNFDPHTGLKYAACWASSNPDATPVNNDFLVSPAFTLGASNNQVSFWVKSMSNSYDLETYRVYVYLGSGTPTALSDFVTPALTGIPAAVAPYPNWEQKTFSLNNWSNQTIRIGIRCTSSDRYMFMVDDFLVTSSNLRTNDVLANKFSVFPNPATNVINVNSSDAIGVNQIQITDLNGRIVKDVTFDGVSEIQVNIGDLTSGMYMMNIVSEEGTAVKKIVRK